MTMSLRKRHIAALICVVLATVTLAAYRQVKDCGFVRYDDNFYITGNPHIGEGLTAENLKWALTSIDASNWHPLTWISYLVDVDLSGGVDAGRFHMTNLLLHLANVLLLFLLLRRLTKSVWRSAFVAALFAVHPLHVESVAWVAERKDVLSTIFWLLTIWAYVHYTEKPGVKRYLPVVILYVLGLMSKPMLVTLPIVMLVLDFWPLSRLQTADNRQQKGLAKLILEKVPLLMLAVASCVITYHAQKAGSAVTEFETMPLGVRLANASVAYVMYLWKMVWPAKLAVMYPHPGPGLPVALVAGSAVFVAAMTAFAIVSARKRPYLTAGWLWYVISLIPVIGIVQVGQQAMADRYTYIPLVGVFVMIAWGVPEILRKGERGKGGKGADERRTFNVQRSTLNALLFVPALVVTIVLATMTYRQTVYWKDSVALFNHEIEAVGETSTSYYYLAGSLYDEQRYSEAVDAYTKAVECDPQYMRAYYNLAVAAYSAERYAEAWKAIHAAEELGASVQPEFLQALSSKMPDPGQ